MSALYEHDRAVIACGFDRLCGVDEAGRGPLAGPVYAAAVILPADAGTEIEGLNDSKKLTASRREKLYDEITASAVYHIASVDAAVIDEINILQATLRGMREAVAGLLAAPDLVLVDGNADPKLPCESRLIVKGDAFAACIAAASILAKVARDRAMLALDAQYPQYRFAQHKGYGTKLHYEMLEVHGPSPVHRRSFLKKFWERRQ